MMASTARRALAVLTSGGDAPGMNAAVRAVVRTALAHDVAIYGVYEGYEGLVQGGDLIRSLGWNDVSGILQRGGTVLGTARSAAFRTREGRLQAALHLLERGIDGLVVIGGDGSLTGADLFRREWPELIGTLVATEQLEPALAAHYPGLSIAGLVGSIDNDMWGTDMTIGADTALHRITAAVDAIASTAASHRRSFVVEVMGRNCGYLALMAAIATGAEWVLIPEYPPDGDDWESTMCEVLKAGRAAGRRDTIVIVAEGARDRAGRPISSSYVKQVLEERLDEDTRVTMLGHVQRGGAPSVFDRNLSTLLGAASVEALLATPPGSEPQLFGIQNNRITRRSLMQCVEQTHAVANAIAAHDYDTAMELRGRGFQAAFRTHRTLMRAVPHVPTGRPGFRFAILHADGPAPGMNTAVRAAVRLGLDRGHTMLGIRNGFAGLISGAVEELAWDSVSGWVSRGGCELGTSRTVPTDGEMAAIAQTLQAHNIQGLLLVGGAAGYRAMAELKQRRDHFPAFDIPFICLPASIDNNLAGCELSIGADTALNNIAEAIDKIKMVGIAYRRCYVVEVMGRFCGYLAFMSGLATGAEIVYTHEEPMTLRTLAADVGHLAARFEQNKPLGLIVRNEYANPVYTTTFIAELFGEEGRGRFDVRHATLGHFQQGGDPSPFDRIEATRLATACIDFLIDQAGQHTTEGMCIGLEDGSIRLNPLDNMLDRMDPELDRPLLQWWCQLAPIAALMARSAPSTNTDLAASQPRSKRLTSQ